MSKLLCRTDEDKRIGPGVVLKVMAGDRFKAGVMGWYAPDVTNPNPGPAAIPMVMNAFTGGLPAGSVHGSGGQAPGSAALTPHSCTSAIPDRQQQPYEPTGQPLTRLKLDTEWLFP